MCCRGNCSFIKVIITSMSALSQCDDRNTCKQRTTETAAPVLCKSIYTPLTFPQLATLQPELLRFYVDIYGVEEK